MTTHTETAPATYATPSAVLLQSVTTTQDVVWSPETGWAV